MRRVAVIGCGGSGKTTLANELAGRLEVPVVHIDSHYWQIIDGQRVEPSPEQWVTCHRRLIANSEWVMDGMKLGVLDERLARADTVVYLDLSTAACLSGIIRRRMRYRGQLRPDLGVYDRITWEFLRWVWSFRRRPKASRGARQARRVPRTHNPGPATSRRPPLPRHDRAGRHDHRRCVICSYFVAHPIVGCYSAPGRMRSPP
jgi:adenylate kinase family enzyme